MSSRHGHRQQLGMSSHHGHCQQSGVPSGAWPSSGIRLVLWFQACMHAPCLHLLFANKACVHLACTHSLPINAPLVSSHMNYMNYFCVSEQVCMRLPVTHFSPANAPLVSSHKITWRLLPNKQTTTARICTPFSSGLANSTKGSAALLWFANPCFNNLNVA